MYMADVDGQRRSFDRNDPWQRSRIFKYSSVREKKTAAALPCRGFSVGGILAAKSPVRIQIGNPERKN
jgi:hypothetical protein